MHSRLFVVLSANFSQNPMILGIRHYFREIVPKKAKVVNACWDGRGDKGKNKGITVV